MSIKVSAPEGPFSLDIEFNGHNVIFAGIPQDDHIACTLKVFKDTEDVTANFINNPEPNAESLFKILQEINGISSTL